MGAGSANEWEGRLKTAQNEAPRVLVPLRGGGRFIGDLCKRSNGMASIDPSALVGQSLAPIRRRSSKSIPELSPSLDEALAAARVVPVVGAPTAEFSAALAAGGSLPPDSNTGGKSSEGSVSLPSLGAIFHAPRRVPGKDAKGDDGAILAERWRVWSLVGRANGGDWGKPRPGWVDVDYHVGHGSLVDTLTFSFSECLVDRLFPGHSVSDLEVCQVLERILYPVLGFKVGSEIPKKNFYSKSVQLVWEGEHDTVNVGFVAAGGNANTVCVHITGEGCAKLKAGHWVALYQFLCDFDARVTRADLAFDDLEGLHSVEWARKAYESGKFNPVKGRPPSGGLAGDWLTKDSPGGRTVYIGTRGGEKMARIYEKGKEQGDSKSKWVRYEGELHHGDRVIPRDVLLRPHHYLAGMYPAFDWISSVRCVISVAKEKVKIAYSVMVESCRVAYGRLLWAMAEIEGSVEAAFDKLVEGVEDVPRRLLVPV